MFKLIFILCNIHVLANALFCSAFCAINSCTGPSSSQCTACDYPFTLQANRCIIESSSSYKLEATQTNIAINPGSLILCGAYSLIGPYSWNSLITLNYPGPIAQTHIKVSLIFWLFLYDQSTLSDKIYVTLSGLNKTYPINQTTSVSSSNQCNQSHPQIYTKIIAQFTHTDTSSSLIFRINLQDAEQSQWGVNQYYLLVQSCHYSCQICIDSTNTSCSSCKIGFKLSGTVCHTQCLENYGENHNSMTCIICDSYCLSCYYNPQNCSACVTSGVNQSFLIGNTCLAECPDYYYEDYLTHTCKKCPNTNCLQCSQNNPKICYLCENNSYWLNFDCYSSCPVQYFADDLNCTQCVQSCLMCSQSSANCLECLSGYYLQNGTCIQNQVISAQEVINALKYINEEMNSFLTGKWVQQIKKTGVFALFAPGAQLSSTVILHNATLPEAMYESMRFWATFIFFEIPNWQQNGTGIKYVFNQSIPSIIQNNLRLLQEDTQNSVENWRFQRIGFSTYFVLDTYLPLILIGICWIIILAVRCCPKLLNLNKRSIIISFVHKIHNISIFYFVVSMILEWVTFNTSNNIRYISLSISIILSIYILAYYTYIFYQLIPYPWVQICTYKYDTLIQYYSYFIRDIKYTQYGELQQWSIMHFLRPYNYQLLSLYRLIMIMAALPLFQTFEHGCITCMMVIQYLQVVRFIYIWPYYSRWRNIYKLLLELQLLAIFAISTTLSMMSFNLQTYSYAYTILGWVGFVLFFTYNGLYIVYLIIDSVIGCCYTNRERVQYGRKIYYMKILKQKYKLKDQQGQQQQQKQIEIGRKYYKKEQYQQICSLILKGNLINKDYSKLKTVTVKIEEYIIKQISAQSYHITLYRVKDIYMKLKLKKHETNQFQLLGVLKRSVVINKSQNQLYQLINSLYICYNNMADNVKYITLQTLLNIDQSKFSAGQHIPEIQENCQQQIIINIDSGVLKDKINGILKGFPISYDSLMLIV